MVRCAVSVLSLLALAGASQVDLKNDIGERHVKGDFGQLDLIAVCKVSEESVTCWDENGRSKNDYEERVRAVLSNSSQNSSIRYNSKTRFVFFQYTLPAYDEGQVTTQMNSYFNENTETSNFNWSAGYDSYNNRNPREIVAVLTRPKSEKFAKVSTSASLKLQLSSPLESKPGSSIDYAGWKVSIVSTIESKSPPTMLDDKPLRRWAIVAHISDKKASSRQFEWHAYDANGLVVRVVDQEGSPVFVDGDQSNSLLNQSRSRTKSEEVPSLSPAELRVDSFGTVDGNVVISTNIDPQKIGYFRVTTLMYKTITLTGIPLDPRH